MKGKERILVALDVPTVKDALQLVDMLDLYVGGYKIGLELVNAMIASLVAPDIGQDEAEENLREIRVLFNKIAGRFFYDTKIYDIPNTLAGASKAISKFKPMFFNFHASAWEDGTKEVVKNKGGSKALGVTILTTFTSKTCGEVYGNEAAFKVMVFARMLAENGADGVICSPQELALLMEDEKTRKLIKVIPGIRPIWAQPQDQKRTMTPGEAVKAGADYLVIGRPITNPPKDIGGPIQAVERIIKEIEYAEAA